MSDAAIAQAKIAARKAARAVRAVAAGSRPSSEIGLLLRDQVISSGVLACVAPDAFVAAYLPLGDEIDPRPLLDHLHMAGVATCLPVVVQDGAPLLFRAWKPGDPLESASFNTLVPTAAQPVVAPRLLFVPLLAFDCKGYRLGYGGGFYDRTLAQLRAAGPMTAIGIAYAAQAVAAVPRAAEDARLDGIITERGSVALDP